MSSKKHYDSHLARVYSWMLGDFEERMREQMDFFRKQQILPMRSRVAIDLGAGTGIQSVALAGLGFDVIAVDFSKQLLDELSRNKGSHTVTVCESDIVHFINDHPDAASLIVCMGDMLTHLKDQQQITNLITRACALLIPMGTLVLSFRDLSQERMGNDRFFHVRSDESRTMTCFLEYFPEVVLVHDIITEKRNNQWTQAISSYPKFRLSAHVAKELLRENNMRLVHEDVLRGMTYLVARRSA